MPRRLLHWISVAVLAILPLAARGDERKARPRPAPAAALDLFQTDEDKSEEPAAPEPRRFATPAHLPVAFQRRDEVSRAGEGVRAVRASATEPLADKAGKLPPRRGEESLKLAPKREPEKKPPHWMDGLASAGGVVGSLGVVIGLFVLTAWVMRRTGPASTPTLPREAVEVLGRAPLAGRLQVHLVRCGNKIVLVSVSPTGVDTLTEITDADQVDRLAGICAAAGSHSSSAVFRRVLAQFDTHKQPRNIFGQPTLAPADDNYIAPTDRAAQRGARNA